MEFPTEEDVINCLRTVVDPEFPLVDIYTMGLIYNITIKAKELKGEKAKIQEAKEQIGEKAKMDNMDGVRSLDSANIDDSMSPLGMTDDWATDSYLTSE